MSKHSHICETILTSRCHPLPPLCPPVCSCIGVRLAASFLSWGKCGSGHSLPQIKRRESEDWPHGCQIHRDQGIFSSKGFPELSDPDAVPFILEQGTMLIRMPSEGHQFVLPAPSAGREGAAWHLWVVSVIHPLCHFPPPIAGFASGSQHARHPLAFPTPHAPDWPALVSRLPSPPLAWP
jgi:hypothetical protein